MEPYWQVRARKAAEAIGRLVARVERLEMAGFAMEIVSAGGTNTHDMTGAHPRVTELQAGSYALMDAAYAPLSPAFRPALTILGTVISRQETTAILDCGTKVVAVDLANPVPLDSTIQVRELARGTYAIGCLRGSCLAFRGPGGDDHRLLWRHGQSA